MAKKGRPRLQSPRNKQLSFFLTEEDAEYLNKVASSLGLRSRSVVLTAIVEGLIESGFSLAGFIKVGNQIHKRLEKHEFPYQIDLMKALRPISPLPAPDMTDEEIEVFIKKLRAEQKLKRKQKTLTD